MTGARSRRGAAAVVGGLVLISGAGVANPVVQRATAAAAGEAPNVLIIITDDQRANMFGTQPQTERLIRNKGVRFPHAYTTTPTCCPARASIFTGRYPHNHGVRTNDGSTTHLLDHSTTLQAYLQEAGYRTAIFGKFLNGWDHEVDPPYFDRWAFFEARAHNYYYRNTWNVNGRLREVRSYSTRFLQRQATDFIGSSMARRRPWLAYLATAAPHAPFTPQPKYKRTSVPPAPVTPAMKERNRHDKPPYVRSIERSLKDGKSVRRRQLRTLRSVDDLVQAVVKKLVRTNQANNTLILYVSDNGYLHAEHKLMGKTTPYIPSVRIPLLMRWPKRLPLGESDDRLVSNIDIAPTVLDAVGIEPPEEPPMDGRSLLDPSWQRDHLLLEYFRRHSVGTPEWGGTLTKTDQYIEYYQDGGRINATFREYYDLLTDPFQLENALGNDDPTDDPVTFPLRAAQLDEDRQCEGTTGENACP